MKYQYLNYFLSLWETAHFSVLTAFVSSREVAHCHHPTLVFV